MIFFGVSFLTTPVKYRLLYTKFGSGQYLVFLKIKDFVNPTFIVYFSLYLQNFAARYFSKGPKKVSSDT